VTEGTDFNTEERSNGGRLVGPATEGGLDREAAIGSLAEPGWWGGDSPSPDRRPPLLRSSVLAFLRDLRILPPLDSVTPVPSPPVSRSDRS